MTSRFARDDHGAAPPGRRRWLAAIGYLGLSAAGVGIAAAVMLLVAPPLGPVRERLIQQVEARTGRTVTVAGPLSVSLFPRVVVSLGGVTLPPPEGMAGDATVTVPSIDAEMSLWSLLSRRPKLERLTLH